jgi:2',3'-cyclic-nucleotide 2'-phosphodiesterase (5'-nucleotidase family)
MTWDSRHLVGNVMTRDIVETAAAWVPQMKEEGADIVVALSHSGIDANQTDRMENASLFLAGVDGIDAIFTGHQHLVFPGELRWHRRRRQRKGHAVGQAGRSRRFLGLAYGLDRHADRARRQQLEESSIPCPRRARSTSATRTARLPRWSKTFLPLRTR